MTQTEYVYIILHLINSVWFYETKPVIWKVKNYKVLVFVTVRSRVYIPVGL